jgi:hypothetical protein
MKMVWMDGEGREALKTAGLEAGATPHGEWGLRDFAMI